jgi:hypothetical protein
MRLKFTFSWGQNSICSWDRIILSLFMRSKFLIMIQSPDHPFFMRLKFKKSIIRNLDLMIDLLVTSTIMRSKFKKSIIRNFYLMINLLVTSMIMRSKFKINYLNLVSCTCGSFLALIISHMCIRTFDLMIVLAANKLIMRLKLPNNALF